MNTSRRLSLILTAMLSLGCDPGSGDDSTGAGSATDGTTDGPSCVPGQSLACTCPDGAMGAQTCQDDGDGFGACECDGMADSSGGSTDPTDPTDPTDTDSDTDSDTGETAVSFEQDIKPILAQSCGGAVNGCHSREAYNADVDFDCRSWVSFEDAAIGSEIYAGPTAGNATGCPDTPLYDRLLELNSWQCGPGNPGPGLPVVVPGSPDQSYMMMKIYGVGLCNIGQDPSLAMPPPDDVFTISDEQIQTLEAWILAGAPNN